MAGWNDLPPEIRLMIIDNLDFISRIKLSACAKMEQQLVRSTPFKLDEIYFENPFVHLKQKGSLMNIRISNDSCTIGWLNYKKPIILENQNSKETVKTIFKSLGTKCIVGKFTFNVEIGLIDTIKWFRDNINFSPNTVKVVVMGNADVEPFINWPNHVKINLDCIAYRGPLFERLDKYDNIVEFRHQLLNYDIRNMTAAKLMKLPNVTHLGLYRCHITINGFLCWVKQWLVRDDYKELDLFASFPEHIFINVDEIKSEFGDFLTDDPYEWRIGFRSVKFSHFYVRNKLNGRAGKFFISRASIRFQDNDEVQRCLTTS